ncbi:AAA domain (dynein-related subfamily) [Corynebacterium kalinowskii]|uniref:AAA domain (Dynein-related subfamily) n=1 Tax=Corynebacterium kalinowskii TaxID=2675216 RepID=A0A6B8VCX1_9CORY|nr:AAA family ATPase [Corynebacterium kalinowskii]QGU02003.1 AAA domain (dynein-related subfamily) [Corynebacterium kalinowskii]
MAQELQRPPAEVRYAADLELLARLDAELGRTAPKGWRLSAPAVVEFIVGRGEPGDKDYVTQKFIGPIAQVQRCVVTLATNRGLMLIGEPGTAKSLLSELLAAAISGDSSLTIQGSAATTEDAIKYSWNYAMLLAEGPSEKALVPAPMYQGMTSGAVVRFEEITRCAPEVQDALLSILSDRVLTIPEFEGARRNTHAVQGFGVIATANTRDRGVNEMSAALKRRFNFETIGAIGDADVETQLVQRETDYALERAGIPFRLPHDFTEVLVSIFRELRRGTAGGTGVERMSSAMSTAEAVAAGVSAGLESAWFGSGTPGGKELAAAIVGTALKDSKEDIARLKAYSERYLHGSKNPLRASLYEHLELDHVEKHTPR